MVTLKLSKEEYESLSHILMKNDNTDLTNLVNETYYQNPKRTMESRRQFDKKTFEKYAEEVKVKNHNKALAQAHTAMIKAVEQKCSLAYVAFEAIDLEAFDSCRETLLASGYEPNNIVLKKASIVDRWKLSTNREYLLIIKFA